MGTWITGPINSPSTRAHGSVFVAVIKTVFIIYNISVEKQVGNPVSTAGNGPHLAAMHSLYYA